MNISLGKGARLIGQFALAVVVILVGLISLNAIIEAYYFQPDNILGEFLPELSETLLDTWGAGVALILVLQSVMLLIIGIVFLIVHWQSIRGGKQTFFWQLTLMLLMVALHLTAILLLFRATSLAGGSSPVGFWVPAVITAAGLIQSALSMLVLGPHYNML